MATHVLNDGHPSPLNNIKDPQGTHAHAPLSYSIVALDDQLGERLIDIADPVPTGRQILQALQAHPVEEFCLYVVLPTGEFEDLRLDETCDLRGKGAEKVIYFRADRTYRFLLDDRQLEWGKPSISGRVLKGLAGVDPATFDVYLEVRGGQDVLVRDAELVDLSKPGVERFITVIRDTTEGLATLPEMDRHYLERHEIAAEILTDGANTGIVFKGYRAPAGKFTTDTVDVLILLPPGYPDVAPDMFYCDPWLTLREAGRYPTCADVSYAYAGKNWQRWSRHNSSWRPGVDGLHTVIKRFEHAIAEAK